MNYESRIEDARIMQKLNAKYFVRTKMKAELCKKKVKNSVSVKISIMTYSRQIRNLVMLK
jgi:hypothetical protein